MVGAMSDSEATMKWNESQEFEEYRQVSRLAVIAFCLSLLAASALAHPVLWSIPFAGIGLAVMAIGAVRRNDSLTGGRLAIIALVLSSFFAAAAPGQYVSRRLFLQNVAQTHLETWFQLVRENKLPEAFELTRRYDARAPVGANLAELYADKPIDMKFANAEMEQAAKRYMQSKSSELNNFFGDGAGKILVTTQVEPKFIDLMKISRRPDIDSVTLRYELRPEGMDVKQMKVTVERVFRWDLDESHWRVVSLSLIEKASPTSPTSIAKQRASQE